MIEKMKIVCIVTSLSEKKSMLDEIRKLGVLHIREKKAPQASISERFAELTRTYQVLKEIPGSSEEKEILDDNAFDELNCAVLKAIDDTRTLNERKNSLGLIRDSISCWGDFDVSEVSQLDTLGYGLSFYRLGRKELEVLSKDENVRFINLGTVDRMQGIAVIGQPLPREYESSRFVLPSMGLGEIQSSLAEIEVSLSRCSGILSEASKHLASYRNQISRCRNDVIYSQVSRTSETDGSLVWLTGYIPQSEEQVFRSAASENSWGYFIDDVSDDDEFVPTKVRYTRVTSLMKPVFSILGTTPGYHEYDISFWFLGFFAMFFAMIIGDAGYGLCFLAIAVLMHMKQKQTSDTVLLLYLVSFTTIVWGAITGTWFGLEAAMDVPLLKAMVLKPLANYPERFGLTSVDQQNNMMKLCFTIGTIQLTLACIMNIRKKFSQKDLSLVADLGWLLSINSLYFVVLLLVVNVEVNLVPCALLIGLGFLLVCLFGGMAPGKSFSEGLKAGLGDAFTNFLNTISAFGNIMSYIRLFAVGLASLAIAQSFNDMALGMDGFMKVFAVLIFIIGHVLNLVMGLLSVVVHGVRLNLLEFSGQLGMEWSGTPYEPFCESVK